MHNRPTRKPNRLVGHDYAEPGGYFVTFCTRNHSCVLGTIAQPSEGENAVVRLSSWGEHTQQAIRAIPAVYPAVTLEHAVVMPNHVHLLITIHDSPGKTPSLSTIIQQTKRRVSVACGQGVWQSHFHDHIVRDEQDFQNIWQYIDNNPLKWTLDPYYRTP